MNHPGTLAAWGCPRAAGQSYLLFRRLPSWAGHIAEQFLAVVAQKSGDCGNRVIAFLEYQFTRNQAGAPFVFLGAALLSVGGDVFLGDSVDDGADPRPDAGSGAHGAGLVRGVEDEIGEVATVAAGNVFESLEFDVLDA